MSKWMEIRNDFVEEMENGTLVLHIDGFVSEDDNEAGKVIAKVICDLENSTTEIIYLDTVAKYDEEVQEAIREGLENIQEAI